MKKLFRAWPALLMGLLVGCGAAATDNVPATLYAQATAFAAEATGVVQTLAADGTRTVATALFAETYIAQVDGINRQMVATMRAGMPPTQQVVLGGDPSLSFGTPAPGSTSAEGGAGSGAGAGAGGLTTFEPPRTALSVRSSDGCADAVSTEFTPSTPTIYATTRAFNITSGTEMSVEWVFGGATVYTFSFVVEQSDDDFCLWFSITPADVPFTPGDWSVRMLANGAPIASPASFVITDGM